MPNVWIVQGVCFRVIDGDTVVADLDLGWKVWLRDARIRLVNASAPEGKTDKSAIRLRELLPSGTQFILESISLDKYGRCLGTVTLMDGRDVGELLKDEGLAKLGALDATKDT